jgi:hypothetical protein
MIDSSYLDYHILIYYQNYIINHPTTINSKISTPSRVAPSTSPLTNLSLDAKKTEITNPKTIPTRR